MKRHWFAITLFFLSRIYGVGQEDPFIKVDLESIGIEIHLGNYGIAIGDFNNDAREDIYVSRKSGANKLYENIGAFKFKEKSVDLNVHLDMDSRTSIWADLNNDGYQDLIVTGINDPSVVLWNQRGQYFCPEPLLRFHTEASNTFSVNIFDLDNNGSLEILTSNFLSNNELWMLDENGLFQNRAHFYGLEDRQKSMGNICTDLDDDGDQDIIYIHDGYQFHDILENNGPAQKFTRIDDMDRVMTHGQGMGVDIGDINNDGHLDIYITNLYENNLLLNLGNGQYRDIALTAGVDDFGMGWGVSFLDYDNDGWVDIYVSNDSHFSDFPNVLYRNSGDLTFERLENSVVSSDRGGYGNAVVDIDNDGFVDIVQANLGTNDVLEVFRNKGNQNNWIGIKLIGIESNKDAIGAKIRMVDGEGIIHIDEVTGGSGFASQNTSKLHFGIGLETSIQTVEIRWPSGQVQEFYNLNANNYYMLEEGGDIQNLDQTTSVMEVLPLQSITLFPNPVNDILNISANHAENSIEYLQIVDVQGAVVGEYRSIQKNQSLDLSYLINGIYYLRFAGGAHYKIAKIIKL